MADRPSHPAIPAEVQAELQALLAEPESLQRRVHEIVADQPRLRPFLEAWLYQHSVTLDLGGTTHPAAGTRETTPHRIGPYVLGERLGEGGFGQVFVAEQQAPVQRRVALKLLRAGIDSAALVARFRQEQQILASLDHEAIAKVFDAGVTGDGRPYFVLEYVDGGESITSYCDRRRLSIEERLRLLQQVCAGVQHSHDAGVLHRDLKPSNILVREAGDRHVVKIIDFGIAKATSDVGGPAVVTSHREVLGTPEYMAPEQAAAKSQLTGSVDVYALGVLLYELLTGELPFPHLREQPLDELLRILHEQAATAPSRTVAAEPPAAADQRARSRQFTSGSTWRLALRGDLDSITLLALRKEPGRRYASPADLADDLQRHLEHRPVRARRSTVVYRARKTLRRHRAIALLLTLLVAAASATVVLIRHNAEVRQTAQMAEVRSAVAEAQRLYERADHLSLGGREPNQEAAEALRSARAGLLPVLSPSTPELRALLLQIDGRLARVEPEAPRAITACRQFLADADADAGAAVAAPERPAVLTRLGDLLLASGDADGAVSAWMSAQALTPRDTPEEEALVRSLVAALLGSDREDAAAPELDRLLAIEERRFALQPPTPAQALAWADHVDQLGQVLLRRGDHPAARVLYERNLRLANTRLPRWERPDNDAPLADRFAVPLRGLCLVAGWQRSLIGSSRPDRDELQSHWRTLKELAPDLPDVELNRMFDPRKRLQPLDPASGDAAARLAAHVGALGKQLGFEQFDGARDLLATVLCLSKGATAKRDLQPAVDGLLQQIDEHPFDPEWWDAIEEAVTIGTTDERRPGDLLRLATAALRVEELEAKALRLIESERTRSTDPTRRWFLIDTMLARCVQQLGRDEAAARESAARWLGHARAQVDLLGPTPSETPDGRLATCLVDLLEVASSTDAARVPAGALPSADDVLAAVAIRRETTADVLHLTARRLDDRKQEEVALRLAERRCEIQRLLAARATGTEEDYAAAQALGEALGDVARFAPELRARSLREEALTVLRRAATLGRGTPPQIVPIVCDLLYGPLYEMWGSGASTLAPAQMQLLAEAVDAIEAQPAMERARLTRWLLFLPLAFLDFPLWEGWAQRLLRFCDDMVDSRNDYVGWTAKHARRMLLDAVRKCRPTPAALPYLQRLELLDREEIEDPAEARLESASTALAIMRVRAIEATDGTWQRAFAAWVQGIESLPVDRPPPRTGSDKVASLFDAGMELASEVGRNDLARLLVRGLLASGRIPDTSVGKRYAALEQASALRAQGETLAAWVLIERDASDLPASELDTFRTPIIDGVLDGSLLDPPVLALVRAAQHLQRDRPVEAARLFARALSSNFHFLSEAARAFAHAAELEPAEAELWRGLCLTTVQRYSASVHASVAELDQIGDDWSTRLSQRRQTALRDLHDDPVFAGLRGNPEFERLFEPGK